MPYADPEKRASSKAAWWRSQTPEQRSHWVELRRLRRIERRETILTAAKRRPCMDCGHEFPTVCMDFDHRPGEPKLFELGGSTDRFSVARVRAEIAKCDVVCANCHRLRTAARAE